MYFSLVIVAVKIATTRSYMWRSSYIKLDCFEVRMFGFEDEDTYLHSSRIVAVGVRSSSQLIEPWRTWEDGRSFKGMGSQVSRNCFHL